VKRDGSHSLALSEAELVHLLRHAGLVDVASVGRNIEVDLETWLELPKTPKPAAQQIRSDLLAELEGGATTGMRPFHCDNRLMFLQRWVIAVASVAA